MLLDQLADSPSPLFLVATTANLLTHALMYAYFSNTSGLRAWRPLVQRMQIGQHATMLCLICAALCAPVKGCAVPVERYAVDLAFYCWMLRSFLAIFNAPARGKAD